MSENNINAQELLDKILKSGQEYLSKGQQFAEEKLSIPESGDEREKMLDGMKKGAIASAALIGLLGTSGGRKLTGIALKLGGLAAVGTAAYKGYQHWQGKKENEEVQALHQLPNDQAETRSLLLIEAMIAAAYADGNIDDDELSTIKHEILNREVSESLLSQLDAIIAKPLSATELAHKVKDQETACEVYVTTRLLIDDSSSAVEKIYLKNLIKALDLENDLIDLLEEEIKQ
jgi:uncharacterized membrane protein YebE (DUF533 family)